MKILGIACSPRPKSNSTILLNEALDELKKLNCDTMALYLRKLKFTPCIGCESCSNSGVCIYKDDLTELYNEIDKADKLIVAAPVYFMSLNADAKAMIDRAQANWARKYILKEEASFKKDGFFISTAGMTKPEMHESSVKIIKCFFHVMNINYKKEFLVNKVDAPEDILTKPEMLEEVRKVSREFIK